ncbi:hypothetical protein N9J84_00625 [Porticoccaceae bacterium]|nr:hypothetical protein [Porticoccaceae bacterium]
MGYSGFKIASGNGFNSNILSLMPINIVMNQSHSLGLQEKAERRFVILVSDVSENMNARAGLASATALREELGALETVAMISQTDNTEDTLRSFYRPYRYQILSAATRDILQSKSAQEIAEGRLRSFYSPIPDYALYSFSDDPLNVSGSWVQSLFKRSVAVSHNDLPSVQEDDVTWHLITGELQGSPFNLRIQEPLVKVIGEFEQKHPHLRLLTSGLVFHAASGSKLAQAEISTVGLGSLLAVLLLVLVVFRSLRQSLFILLVLGSSALVALSATWWIFGNVHLVTVAFGSTLLGLAADYCFHFLVKLNATGSPDKAINLLFKGLIISALSSVTAYLIQLFSPFPGLQQFAVFVASGLAAACFTVLVLAGQFSEREPKPVRLGSIYDGCLEPLYARVHVHSRAFIALFMVLLLSLVAIVMSRGVSDDLRLLNTSGSELISVEAKVSSLLGSVESQRYFLIEGNSRQEVLLRSQNVIDSVGLHSSIDLISVTQIMPALEQQRSDYVLIKEKIFSSEGALSILCDRLDSDCRWRQPIPAFNPTLGNNKFPTVMQSLFPQLSMLKDNVSVVFFRDPSKVDLALFKSLQLKGVTYIDRVESLSNLLKQFRNQVSWLLAGFLGLLLIISYWMFSRGSLIVMGSVIASSVTALFFAAPNGVSLFHILALLLVVGIAVDTAVFFITPGLDRNTWSAATLASLTSIIAFGLLSMSKVPLLNQFGQVVAYGLVTSWIITPMFWFIFNQSYKK